MVYRYNFNILGSKISQVGKLEYELENFYYAGSMF